MGDDVQGERHLASVGSRKRLLGLKCVVGEVELETTVGRGGGVSPVQSRMTKSDNKEVIKQAGGHLEKCASSGSQSVRRCA